MNYKKLLLALLIVSLVSNGLVLWKLRSSDPDFLMGKLKLQVTQSSVDRTTFYFSDEDRDRLSENLAWDYVFIALYVFLLWLAMQLVPPPAGAAADTEAIPARARYLPFLAGVFDLMENRGLKEIIDGSESAWVPLARAAATAATLVTILAVFYFLVRGWIRAGRLAMPAVVLGKGETPLDLETTLDDVLARERTILGVEDDRPTVGLALSGGGIRSATFNLGLLRSLARLELLRRFDYLSTISGGGYIGAWLHQWLRHEGLDAVEGQLRQEPDEDKPEPETVTHLRNYSNYLTPRLGLLSADTWATVATYVRNLLLNLVIIVALGGAILVIPRAVADTLDFLGRVFRGTTLQTIDLDLRFMGVVTIGHLWAFLAFFALALTGIIGIGLSLAAAVTKVSRSTDRVTSQSAVQLNTVVPLVAAAVLGSYWLWAIGSHTSMWLWIAGTPVAYMFPWAVAVLVADFVSDPEQTQAIAGTEESCEDDPPTSPADMRRELREMWIDLGFRYVIWAVPVGLVGGLALWGVTQWFSPAEGAPWSLWRLVTFGPPFFMALFTITTVLHIGLLGRHLNDHLREWLARAGAWILIYSLGWVILNGAAIYGPVLLESASATWKTGLASGWLATSIWAAVAGNAQQQGQGRAWHGPALKIAPWIFILGLTLGLAWGVDRLLSIGHEAEWKSFSGKIEAAVPAGADAGEAPAITGFVTDFGERARRHETLLDLQLADNFFWLWALVLGAVALGLSFRVAINEFSMHQYYRNRLARAYLGASNPDRKPNPFTGFDPEDDSLLGVDFERTDDDTKRKVERSKPLHLIGAALNLVHGSRLGWQERKAASFVFTPFYSGFSLPADRGDAGPMDFYRKTCEVEGLKLGTAMAISGAAASPNMGFRSTPALSLLLTVFNVRLGWWLGNPAHPESWARGGPSFALKPLIAELFGLTSERSPDVYLSDGGHFENLGIYELVRRRCRFIVVTDASADPDLEFSDLGNAIRKCRTDFGAEISINIDPLRAGEKGMSRRHCAVGTIKYAAKEPGGMPEFGELLYIKPTLTGDEPEDVLQYADASDGFPHQSTADQFFDESQFESYRALGEHIGLRTFVSASPDLGPTFKGWETLFTQLRERWVAPSPSVERSFSRHGESLDRLLQRLGTDDNLRFMDAEIYPEFETLVDQALDVEGLPNTPDNFRSGFYLSSSLIQLMENVHLDLQLDDEHSHPDNRGWINLFRQFSGSPMVRATFAITAGTYGSRFQTFCRRRFGLEMGSVGVETAPQSKASDYLQQIGRESARLGQEISERLEEAAGNTKYQWLTFNLEVADPEFKVPVGFGLTETHPAENGGEPREQLLYFQIVEHLRRTGLARRGLATFKRKYPGVLPTQDDRRFKALSARRWSKFHHFFKDAQD